MQEACVLWRVHEGFDCGWSRFAQWVSPARTLKGERCAESVNRFAAMGKGDDHCITPRFCCCEDRVGCAEIDGEGMH